MLSIAMPREMNWLCPMALLPILLWYTPAVCFSTSCSVSKFWSSICFSVITVSDCGVSRCVSDKPVAAEEYGTV